MYIYIYICIVIIKHGRCVIFKTTAAGVGKWRAGHSLYFSRFCFFVCAYILYVYNMNVCEYDINIFFFGV